MVWSFHLFNLFTRAQLFEQQYLKVIQGLSICVNFDISRNTNKDFSQTFSLFSFNLKDFFVPCRLNKLLKTIQWMRWKPQLTFNNLWVSVNWFSNNWAYWYSRSLFLSAVTWIKWQEKERCWECFWTLIMTAIIIIESKNIPSIFLFPAT